jgi:hypothetical protein
MLFRPTAKLPSYGVRVATKSTEKQGLTPIVVKKATPKKATKQIEKNVGGRPKRDPNTLRTERLVIRTHPDLMRYLTELAGRNGITRSMLVERTLVSFVNLTIGEVVLDSMGRELKGRRAADGPSAVGTCRRRRSTNLRATTRTDRARKTFESRNVVRNFESLSVT